MKLWVKPSIHMASSWHCFTKSWGNSKIVNGSWFQRKWVRCWTPILIGSDWFIRIFQKFPIINQFYGNRGPGVPLVGVVRRCQMSERYGFRWLPGSLVCNCCEMRGPTPEYRYHLQGLTIITRSIAKTIHVQVNLSILAMKSPCSPTTWASCRPS